MGQISRKKLEKQAEKIGKQLDRSSAMEYAESCQTGNNTGVKWIVRTPGMADGAGFRTLSEVDDYLSIGLGGIVFTKPFLGSRTRSWH